MEIIALKSGDNIYYRLSGLSDCWACLSNYISTSDTARPLSGWPEVTLPLYQVTDLQEREVNKKLVPGKTLRGELGPRVEGLGGGRGCMVHHKTEQSLLGQDNYQTQSTRHTKPPTPRLTN